MASSDHETRPAQDELPMRLTRLRVKNFRSIAEMDIPLSPLTVLVGPNGSGKSNVVDALRFVRDIFTRGLDQAVMDREGMNVIQRWGSKEDVSVEISFLVAEREEDHYISSEDGDDFITTTEPAIQIDYRFTINELNREINIESQDLSMKIIGEENSFLQVARKKREITGKLGKNQIINLKSQKSLFSNSYENTGSALPTHLFFLSRALFEDTDDIFSFMEPKNPTHASWWRTYEEYFKQFIDYVESSNFYTLNPADLRQPQQVLKESPFDEKGRNMAAVLRRLKRTDESDWDNLRHSLQQAVAGFEDIEVEPVGGYLATKLTYQSANAIPRTSYLGQESDGTIRMLGLLTALYQDPQQPFIAIEEPEANIHPGALAVLAGVLDQASLRSQIVLTTHSPDILDQLPVESFLVVEKVGDATRVGPLEASQVQSVRKKLFTAGELLRMEGLQRQPEPNETT